ARSGAAADAINGLGGTVAATKAVVDAARKERRDAQLRIGRFIKMACMSNVPKWREKRPYDTQGERVIQRIPSGYSTASSSGKRVARRSALAVSCRDRKCRVAIRVSDGNGERAIVVEFH